MGKESASNAGNKGVTSSIPGLGRSSTGRHGNPLQYSCLENPMDRGAWQAMVHGVTKIRHKLVTKHIYKIDEQQDSLYSTGNSAQYSEIT